jgi:uncharacterized protein (UPF0548 family)
MISAMTGVAIESRRLSYQRGGSTRPDLGEWTPPTGFRSFESTTQIGAGSADWAEVTHGVMRWAVKTRSGFRVDSLPDRDVMIGERRWITLRVGPVSVREPVEIVAVIDDGDRRGFAYGTLEGHPVSGEEAFIVHRSPDDTIWFTLRSLTRAPHGGWRVVYPIALVAQRVFRRRYQRALLIGDSRAR